MARYSMNSKIVKIRFEVYEPKKLSLKVFNKKKLLKNRLKISESLKS